MKNLSSKLTLTRAAVGILAVSSIFSLKANAALIDTFPGNDCAGTFGTPPNCVDPDGSPLILKIDFSGVTPVDFTFGNFTTINGNEFSFDFGTDGNTGTGTWTYNPGPGDPIITSYVAKGGPNFNLFSNEPPLNSGEYFTPINAGGNIPELSRITFFDSPSNGPSPSVPEPTTILGFLAFGGAGLLSSRKRAK